MLVPKITVDICRFSIYDLDSCELSQVSIGRSNFQFRWDINVHEYGCLHVPLYICVCMSMYMSMYIHVHICVSICVYVDVQDSHICVNELSWSIALLLTINWCVHWKLGKCTYCILLEKLYETRIRTWHFAKLNISLKNSSICLTSLWHISQGTYHKGIKKKVC